MNSSTYIETDEPVSVLNCPFNKKDLNKKVAATFRRYDFESLVKNAHKVRQH